MLRTRRTFALLAALLLLPCAQGCRTSAGATQAALSKQQSPNPSATPEPYAPPFSAQKRGDEAFEPFVNLSGGRVFASREVGRRPARKDLKVSANYPELLGDDGPAAREFNRRARALVLEDVTPYLESDPDPEKENNPNWKDVEEFYDVSHKVVFASDELASVLFYKEGYRWGAGHSFHEPVTFNFDLKAGREVKLAELFRPGADYLRALKNLCDEDLKRQFGSRYPQGEVTGLEGGLQPKAKNFESWVVTRDGLVIIFAEYRVMAYADGEPKVLIPFDSLREIIDPGGPLAGPATAE